MNLCKRKRELVIDYVTRDEKTREKIRSILKGEVKLDHHPIIVTIEGKEKRRREYK